MAWRAWQVGWERDGAGCAAAGDGGGRVGKGLELLRGHVDSACGRPKPTAFAAPDSVAVLWNGTATRTALALLPSHNMMASG